jgi:transcriptional regulator with XRE-family HTH domain
MINQNMGKIIDEIRQERKLTREDLCEEIMSVRNYQRFINEEVNLSNDKLSKLIDRLNLDYFTLREIYAHRSEDIYSQLHSIYQLMQGNSDQIAYDALQKVNTKNIDSNYVQLFYNYLKIDLERQLQIVPLDESIKKLEELIDYPEIMDFEVLNFIELNVLAILNTYYTKKEDDTIANFLYKFLTDTNLNKKGLMPSFLPSLYSTTAQSFGSFLQYDKALEVSNKGIEECIKLQMFNGLYHLLYFKSLSELKLGKKEESLITQKRLYALLYALDEEDKKREYLQIFDTAFNNKLEINFYIK